MKPLEDMKKITSWVGLKNMVVKYIREAGEFSDKGKRPMSK